MLPLLYKFTLMALEDTMSRYPTQSNYRKTDTDQFSHEWPKVETNVHFMCQFYVVCLSGDLPDDLVFP